MSDLSVIGSDFGYRFEPLGAADQPVHRKLTVVIRSKPTEERFDPDKLQCRVATTRGELEYLEVFHPWAFLADYRLAAGRIEIIGRHNKKAEAFSFGGRLHIDTNSDQTTAVCESPAPILALLTENPFLSTLAARAEALLARRQAEWDSRGQLEQYETRLAALDPLVLYHACLGGLRQSVAQGGTLGVTQDKQLEHLLAADPPAGDPLEKLL
jgi:hypothetical protein